ncbi:MAG: transporter substrate-binding domain-containing protein [Acidobacteria bacterium]|nr:transporter substrate-binding domain-containing protein [Acidobacteriota bacterium]
MKRIVIGMVTIALIVLGFVAPATAADNAPVLSRIVATKVVRVGVSGAQPPFNVINKSGELMGYDIDLANLLADAMGVKVQFVKMPFAQLLPALEQGKVDMVMSGVTMSPERNLKAAFVGPYIVSGKAVLTSSDALAAINKTEDLDKSSLRIAALEGSTSQKFVEQAMPKVQLIKVPDYDTGVKMLIEHKIDAMVADYPICAISELRYKDKGLIASKKPLTIEPIGIALPPNDFLMVNMVTNYVGTLQAVGVLDMLEAKWFEDGSWLVQLP